MPSKNTSPVAIAACLLAGMMLSGCSASTPASFATVEALKDAYVSAGAPCEEWQQGDAVGAWAQFGNCGDGATLSTYSSETDLNATLANLKVSEQMKARAFVGENWIIVTDEHEDIGLSMNATIVSLKG